MTTLKLSPNASGAGSFTIAAPSTSSTLTLNLPSTLGTNNGSALVSTDASGNLGLGVAPSAWASVTPVFQVNRASFYGYSNEARMSANYYYNAGDKYIASDYATSYSQRNGQHVWYIAPSGTAGNAISFTQAMTLDASGRLSLGVTSPSLSFEVGQNTAKGYMHSGVGVFSVGTSTNHPYTFDINGSERARIDSSGNLLVGVTSAAGRKFYVSGSVDSNHLSSFFNTSTTAPAGIQIQYSNTAPNNTGSAFLYCEDQSVFRMSVRSNGGIANYSANNVNLSDRREKTNFAPAGEYLSKICAIPVQTFNYIDQNTEEDPGTTLGVVAQDVQAVAPELVMESNWGTEENPKMRLSIYQTDLQYALMKCIQEQQTLIQDQLAIINTQQTELEQLKAQLTSVSADVAALKGAK